MSIVGDASALGAETIGAAANQIDGTERREAPSEQLKPARPSRTTTSLPTTTPGVSDFFDLDELRRARLRVDIRQVVAELVAAYKYGYPGRAPPLLRRLQELAPDSAEADYFTALQQYDRGRRAEALILAQRAAAKSPRMSRANSLIGLLLMDAQRYEEATIAFRAAVEQSPYNANYLYNLANALHTLGRSSEALTAADRAIAARSNFAEALYLRGLLLLNMGEALAALQSLKRAEHFGMRSDGFYLDLLLAAERAEQQEDAIAAARQLQSTRDPHALRETARVHLHFGESQIALRRLERLVQLKEATEGDFEMLLRAAILSDANPTVYIMRYTSGERRAALLLKARELEQQLANRPAARDSVVRSPYRPPPAMPQ
ncbi:MAG: tetratricopeptide repeat protein [Leptospirales bacterium]|nr:tetratricopeptide repeat protein [Leptospirales bacterium]